MVKRNYVLEYVAVSPEEAVKPKDGYIAYVDRYWLCNAEGHLLFAKFPGYLAPQCNSDQRIFDFMGHEFETQVRFFPLVFVRPSSL